MRKNAVLYTAFGLIGSGAWAMTSQDFRAQVIGAFLIFGGVCCLVDWLFFEKEDNFKKVHDTRIKLKKELIKFFDTKIKEGNKLYDSNLKDVDESIKALKTFGEWVTCPHLLHH